MKPTAQRVLSVLASYGDAGVTAPEIARAFDEPPGEGAGQQRRNSRVNSILAVFARNGHARRGGGEGSPVYNNVRCYRWYITDDGREYLGSDMMEGVWRARREARESAISERQRIERHQEGLLAQVGELSLRHKCERDAEIRHLWAEGCVLDDIGRLFGITRERVRQIVMGYKVNPCDVPGHDYMMTSCSHGVVRPPDPAARRWPVRAMRRDGFPAHPPQVDALSGT